MLPTGLPALPVGAFMAVGGIVFWSEALVYRAEGDLLFFLPVGSIYIIT